MTAIWQTSRTTPLSQVHPFLDGNGRTGRLALNPSLARLGHPPGASG